jgi:hypothetical protein
MAKIDNTDNIDNRPASYNRLKIGQH